MFSRISHIAISSVLGAIILTQPVLAATVTGVQTQVIANNDTIASGWFQQANDRLLPFGISSGNVGIGTASPEAGFELYNKSLYVRDNTNTIFSIVGGGGNTPDILVHKGNNQDATISVEKKFGDTLGEAMIKFLDRGSANDWKISTDAINSGLGIYELGNTNSRIFLKSGGNIGIGTSTPGAKLEVAGQVKITDGTQGAGKVLTSDANGLASWQTVSGGGGSSQWTTAGSNIAYTGGNVGIGTSSPSYKLHVNGVGYFGDPAATYNPSTYAQTYNYSINLGGFPISYTLYNSYDGGYWGNLFIGGAGMWSGQRTTLSGQFNQSIGGTALGNITSGSSNNVFGWGALYTLTSGSSNTVMGRDAGYNLTSGSSNTFIGSSAGNTMTIGSNNVMIGANTQPPSTTGSNQLNIGNWIYGNGGNIGIGTSSPGAKLEIISSASAPNADFVVKNGQKWFSINQAGSGSYNPTTGPGQGIFFSNDADNATSTEGFTIAPWSTVAGGLRIMENGNVGIGTISPSQKLSVAGTVESTNGGFKFPDGTTQTTASAGGGVPAGAIMAFNLASCPTGWIAANGTNGTPDLRGEFIRGLDSGRGVDTSRTLGSWQVDMLGSHTHTFASQTWGGSTVAPRGVSGNASGTDGDLDGSTTVTGYDKSSVTLALNNAGGSETRPRNVALLYCQKQ